jgi:hypothetical protein
VGNARADLARTWSLLVTLAPGNGPRARAAASVGRLLAAGWRKGYEEVAGGQSDMLLFELWALTVLVQTTRTETTAYGSSLEPASLQRRLAELRRRAGLSAA